MTDPGYYDTSYPPELWAAPAAPPVVGAARDGGAEGAVGADGDGRAPRLLAAAGTAEPAGDDGLGVVVTSDGVEHVGILPASAAEPEGEGEQGARPSGPTRRSSGKRRR